MPLIEFPYRSSGGDHVATAPIPGSTESNPPDTPLLLGIPISLVNFPAPLYMPQVVIRVTTACTVEGSIIFSPVDVFIPLLASIAPNRAKDLQSIKMEQHLKYKSRASSACFLVSYSLS